MPKENKFIYENKNTIYKNPYLRRNQHDMNSSTNITSLVDYKTLYEKEKQLKEESLVKIDKISETALKILNKLQQENVKLKDENKKLIDENKDINERNLKLVEENESLNINNQILVIEKSHLEHIYQELSDLMMFLSNFFGHEFDAAKNIFYNNYYNHIEPEPELDIYLENNHYLVTENEVEIEAMTDIESVISIDVDSLDDDYDNYLLDNECNNFVYHQSNCL
jgi:hypothetical protein